MSTPTPLNAVWTTPADTNEVRVSTWADVTRIIEAIQTQHPPVPAMAEFFDPATGLALCIGVGRADSVVTFQASLDPPYFISLGEQTTREVIVFDYGNEPTEYSGLNRIPFPDALRALELFWISRNRPSNLKWEQL